MFWRTIIKLLRGQRTGVSAWKSRTFLVIVMLTGAVLCGGAKDEALSEESSSMPSSTAAAPHQMDFKDCVRLAVEQSPYFVENEIEIEVKRLNESESLGSFIPSISLRTSRYLNLERNGEAVNDYTVGFGVDEYNPLTSYFSLKASKIVTEIAITAHKKAMVKGVYELAENFLAWDTLNQLAACQEQIVALQQEKLSFYKTQYDNGSATQMEVQYAEVQLDLAKAEDSHLTEQRATLKERIKKFLGMSSSRRLDVNLDSAKKQILGPFDPWSADLDEAKRNSFDLKIQTLKKDLQEYRIYQAYNEFLPKVYGAMRQTSPLDVQQENDFYYEMGFRVNLWRGLKDVNGVSKQKKILRQFENKAELASAELDLEWQDTKSALRDAEAGLKLARSNERLAGFKEEQSKILYESNSQEQSSLLAQRIKHVDARKDRLVKTQDYNLVVLKLRHLAGDLFGSFIRLESDKE